MLVGSETASATAARTAIDMHNGATESFLHHAAGAPRPDLPARLAAGRPTLRTVASTNPVPVARTIGTP